jgi:hypothetical protein
MSVILLMIGLHYLYAGTVGGEQVSTAESKGIDTNLPNT